jgi:hypothetical protein
MKFCVLEVSGAGWLRYTHGQDDDFARRRHQETHRMVAPRVLPASALPCLILGLYLTLWASAPAAGHPASKAGDDHGYAPSAGAFASLLTEREPDDTPGAA